MHRRSHMSAMGMIGLAMAVLVSACSSASGSVQPDASTTSSTTTTTVSTTTSSGSSTTTTTIPPTTTVAGPPAPGPRYVVPQTEVEREAKQLAVDIAYTLTTYEESDDPAVRFIGIAGAADAADLAEAGEPLTLPGMWSRGEIVYPQLGGLTANKVSVMTVTRQTVGIGPDVEFSLVRTLDIRLVKGASGWEFDELASAGGVFATVEDLALAHAVASDPRIEMPDSARLDILDGKISPVLLGVMLDIANITPYGITVMATGHPYHVFETNRVSHHTIGRAIDINRVGDRHVIDDRAAGSKTHTLVQWLWENSTVVQVGSPWDVDPSTMKRSFTNTVHQDHIHVAVIGPNDPTWVPAIGNRVWEDLDADGIQDSGEPGIAGVTVRLFDEDDIEMASTVTNSSGTYEFRDLYYGEFHVEIDVPSGYVASPRDQGSNDATDSDITTSGAMSATTLDPREHDTRWDAGLYRRASIGNRVWEDLDADGIQDSGEPGVAGVTVRLFDVRGTVVATTVTAADGTYGFADLTPGTYHVAVQIPAGFVATLRDRGSDDAADSDIDSAGVMTTTDLVSNEQDRTWDAGITRPASIGDFVWEDLDGDGIQDPGEPGVAGVTVRLFNAGGTEIASVETDDDGLYEFENLRPGTYHIEIDIPDGYVASLLDEGIDDEVDSDIDDEGVMEPTTLGPGEFDDTWDAGIRLA